MARRHRNRANVLDAVVELFRSGNCEPAVEDVAEWSGVSTRSIYRYFRHRDGLVDAAMWHLVEIVSNERPLELGNGPLSDRIARFVSHRLDIYQRVAPLTRAARRATPSNDDVDGVRAETSGDEIVDDPNRPPQSVFVDRIADCFPAELARLPADLRVQSAVAAEMAVRFDSLEFLVDSLDGDLGTVASLLERLLHQQLDLLPAAAPASSEQDVAPNRASIL